MADQAQGLRELMGRSRHPIDYAALWQGLESDVERWVMVGGFDKPNLPDEALAQFWDLMQSRKEQSR